MANATGSRLETLGEWMERVNWFYLDQEIASLESSSYGSVTINADIFFGLAHHRGVVLNRYKNALRRCKKKGIIFDCKPPVENVLGTLNEERFYAMSTMLGTILRSKASLEYIKIVNAQFHMLDVALHVLSECRQIRKLHVDFIDEPDPVNLIMGPFLRKSLHGRRRLEDICAHNVQSWALEIIMDEMQSMPKLSSCTLHGSLVGFIETSTTHRELAQLFSIPSLRSLWLENVRVLPQTSTHYKCQLPYNSPIRKLTLVNVTFQKCCHEALTEFISFSGIVRLNFFSHTSEKFMKTFSQQLANHPTLESLAFGGARYSSPLARHYEDPSRMVSFLLGGAEQMRVRMLSIQVSDWTSTLEAALVHYITRCEYLQELDIALPFAYAGAPVSSQLLLNVIDTGKRNLWRFNCSPAWKFDVVWLNEMKLVAELNYERVRLEPYMATLVRAQTEARREQLLVDFLGQLSTIVLSRFLQRNEWNLQELIRHYGRQRNAANSLGNRQDETRLLQALMDSLIHGK